MKREDAFEKYKVTKVSTQKVVCNVYMDSFGIEKVRIQNFVYDSKESAEVYLDFSTVARLAIDAASGRLIKKIEEAERQYDVYIGGRAKGDDGKPLSRRMFLKKSGDKIFINITEGPGKLSDTGAILPAGEPTVKIGVPVTIEDFREMLFYTHDCVNAYLVSMVGKLVDQCEAERQAAKDAKEKNKN